MAFNSCAAEAGVANLGRLAHSVHQDLAYIIVRDGLADHRGFTSFQFVKLCVEESLRLAVAEPQHLDVSSRTGQRFIRALQPDNPLTTAIPNYSSPFAPCFQLRWSLLQGQLLPRVTDAH